MKIIPISLPTPFYIGPVNVYLIKEDPVTLIDTGPKTPEAIAALRSGLRSAGLSVNNIRRIVLTHAHEDHCGLARSLRDEAKDADVYVHNWETGTSGQPAGARRESAPVTARRRSRRRDPIDAPAVRRRASIR
jgi:glyoxylase-like metal-dependent hydrolase (beta-lactamase superfamily II)